MPDFMEYIHKTNEGHSKIIESLSNNLSKITIQESSFNEKNRENYINKIASQLIKKIIKKN